MGRSPFGWMAPIWVDGIKFDPIPSVPALRTIPNIIISTGEGSPLTLPIISYRRPTGAESFGLDNHLTVKELAQRPTAKIALYDIPLSWYIAVPNLAGPLRTPNGRVPSGPHLGGNKYPNAGMTRMSMIRRLGIITRVTRTTRVT